MVMPLKLKGRLPLWRACSIEQLRRLVKRRNELAQHCIHHLGVDGVVGRHSPSSLQVYLKITVVFLGSVALVTSTIT